MNILKSLFNNEGLKKSIMKNFISDFKKQGIKKVIVLIDENDEIDIQVIEENSILVKKETYDFLNKFYKENKKV